MEPGGGAEVDASATGDPNVDSDGDGYNDAVDNCPHMYNPDQHDFDGDLRGDVCDVCPHIMEGGKDYDGDGVGDACDPNPQAAGDKIVFFDGFYDMGNWTAVEGTATWKIDGGMRQPTADGIYQIVHPANPAPNNVFVETKLRVNASSQGVGQRHAVGLVAGYQSTDEYFFCGIAQAFDASEVEAGYVDPQSSGSFNYNSGALSAQMAGDWFVLQATTAQQSGGDTHLGCTGALDTNTQGAADWDAYTSPAGEISLRTNGVDATFKYVFVVESP